MGKRFSQKNIVKALIVFTFLAFSTSLVSAQDYDEEWEYDYGGFVNDVAGEDGEAFVGGDENTLQKLDENGDEDWSYDYGDPIKAVDTDSDGNIYLGGEGNELVRLDSDGNEDYTYDYGDEINDIAVENNSAWIGGGGDDIRKIDSNGDEEWSYLYGETVNGVDVENGKSYAGGLDDSVVQVDEDGNEDWTYDTDATIETISGGDGKVYAGGMTDEIVQLNPDNGNEEWSYDYGESVYGLSAENDAIYGGGYGGEFVKVDDDGNEEWDFNYPNTINGVDVDGGNIYMGGDDSTVQKLSEPQEATGSYNSPDDNEEFTAGDTVTYNYTVNSDDDGEAELVKSVEGEDIDFDDSNTYTIIDTVNHSEGEESYEYDEEDVDIGDYEWGVIYDGDDTGETNFGTRSYSVISDLTLEDPVPYTFDGAIRDEESYEFYTYEEFRGYMNYTGGSDDAEGDIYLKPQDGWNEPDTVLEDDEWYGDTAIKELNESEGEINTPISEIEKDFPFENTSGTFDMKGLANESGSVPTTVADDELDDFDEETDTVEFDVNFLEDLTIDLDIPEDDESFEGSQDVDFNFSVSDPDQQEYDVGLYLNESEDEDEELIFNDSVDEGADGEQEFDHTEEDLDVGEYDYRVEVNRSEDTFEESRSFEITETLIKQIIDTITAPLQEFWNELMNELGETGKAMLGLIFVLITGLIGYAVAENVGAIIGMSTAFLIAIIIGLFPGWIAIILGLVSIAIISFGGG